VIDAAFSLSARLDVLPSARKEAVRAAREQRASRPAPEEFGDAPEGFSVAAAGARASGGKEVPD
jgi:hypothetical protein